MPRRNTFDVLVIGGGVAGLVAAGELARSGLAVALLEARERVGGRVFTVHPQGWDAPVELGAEFIHEGNPELWKLLRPYRIATRRVPTTHWRFTERAIERIPDVENEIERVTKRIDAERMRGWSFADFLRFKGRTISAREHEMVADFVEGFQAAPLEEMSATAVEGETLDTSEQFVVPTGLDRFVETLAVEAAKSGVVFRLRTPVRKIAWRRGHVVVHAGAREFHGRAAVVTLPLGVLQAKPPQRGAVAFTPALREKRRVIAAMETGEVIRITLRFDARAWRALLPRTLRRARGGFGFLHSHVEGVPVWWSLSGRPVITGWAGGPRAKRLAQLPEKGVFEHALTALSDVFGVPLTQLRRAVLDWETHNWSRDPFSRGAYSFIAAGRDEASKKLREPVRETLFFAGEATADDEEIGTVHGALTSGLRAAEEVRKAFARSR